MGGPSLWLRGPIPAALAVGLLTAPASAQELGGFRFLVTETSIFNYRIDYRGAERTNDNYGEWLNRLNVQASRGPFTAQVRLDSAPYFLNPDSNLLAREQANAETGAIQDRANTDGVSFDEARAGFIQQQTIAFGRDLSTRYVNTFYPSKLAMTAYSPITPITLPVAGSSRSIVTIPFSKASSSARSAR